MKAIPARKLVIGLREEFLDMVYTKIRTDLLPLRNSLAFSNPESHILLQIKEERAVVSLLYSIHALGRKDCSRSFRLFQERRLNLSTTSSQQGGRKQNTDESSYHICLHINSDYSETVTVYAAGLISNEGCCDICRLSRSR